MLIVRMLAADSASLRAAVIAVLAVLREGRPLPRVWLC
jgi:urease accessory protein